MKVIRVNDLEGVPFTGGVSFRPVLASHNIGFSVCKTVLPVGGPNRWHYKHHQEACYCIKGKAILHNLETGVKTMITPDVVYVLDNHDDHTLEVLEDMILISIFNPPLTGKETHDKDGSYTI